MLRQRNFAFDAVFWKKLDLRFFGPCISANEGEEEDEHAWKMLVELLDTSDREILETVIKRKLEEMKDRVLAWEPDEVHDQRPATVGVEMGTSGGLKMWTF